MDSSGVGVNEVDSVNSVDVEATVEDVSDPVRVIVPVGVYVETNCVSVYVEASDVVSNVVSGEDDSVSVEDSGEVMVGSVPDPVKSSELVALVVWLTDEGVKGLGVAGRMTVPNGLGRDGAAVGVDHVCFSFETSPAA